MKKSVRRLSSLFNLWRTRRRSSYYLIVAAITCCCLLWRNCEGGKELDGFHLICVSGPHFLRRPNSVLSLPFNEAEVRDEIEPDVNLVAFGAGADGEEGQGGGNVVEVMRHGCEWSVQRSPGKQANSD